MAPMAQRFGRRSRFIVHVCGRSSRLARSHLLARVDMKEAIDFT